jgi:hypothetical protein
MRSKEGKGKKLHENKMVLGWKWPHGHIMGVEGGIGSD